MVFHGVSGAGAWMGQGDLDGGGLAGEGGGWMKRDSIYMIESSNGALDGGCSDGQIWRGTTGGCLDGGRRDAPQQERRNNLNFKAGA